MPIGTQLLQENDRYLAERRKGMLTEQLLEAHNRLQTPRPTEYLIACLEQRIMQAEVHLAEIGEYGTD